MPGLHTVRKPGKAGAPDRWYVYAWRGGPLIHKAQGPRPVIGPALLDAAAAARFATNSAGIKAAHTLDAQIDLYRASPEFAALAASTRRDYRLWLDRISLRFGPAPLPAFADARMRGDIIDWRDGWASQPRTADKASVMMATLLGWIVQRGRLPVNVASAIPQLHRADKADEVWERRHQRAMVNSPLHLRHALLVAAFTGLRLGDLVRLEWSHVGDKAIVLVTRKRKGRVVIPVTPTLRRLLDRIRQWQDALVAELKLESPPTTVLCNSRGQSWTESGLGSVFQKSKPAGFDRRIHDLRGTYATWLATKGLTNEEIARILGWTAKRVDTIRARYVNEERVVISLLERMSA